MYNQYFKTEKVYLPAELLANIRARIDGKGDLRNLFEEALQEVKSTLELDSLPKFFR